MTGKHGDALVKQPKSNYSYAALTRRRVADKLANIKSEVTKVGQQTAQLATTLAADMENTKTSVAMVAEVFHKHIPEEAFEVSSRKLFKHAQKARQTIDFV